MAAHRPPELPGPWGLLERAVRSLADPNGSSAYDAMRAVRAMKTLRALHAESVKLERAQPPYRELVCGGCGEVLFFQFAPDVSACMRISIQCAMCGATSEHAEGGVGERWQHFDGAMVDPVASSEPVACGKHGSHQDGCGACDRVKLTAQLAECDAELRERITGLEVACRANADDMQAAEAERDRLAAELAEVRERLNDISAMLCGRTGEAHDRVLDRIGGLMNAVAERDAAQAALEQAQRDTREWAAGQAEAVLRGEHGLSNLPERIRRGPQPAERGEGE